MIHELSLSKARNFIWRFLRYYLDNLYSAGIHKQKQILFLTWIMMVVEFLGMRVACCEVFLCMTQRGKLFFLFLGHALKNLWVCDLWWMGRKSKYVIEVLEEFAWWATKVFSFHRLRKWWCIVFPLHYSFPFFVTKDLFKWYFCHP